MRNDFYVGCYSDPNYLAHYGILGMKWGIRRYQNSNGSLTSEGKSRYGKKKGKKSSILKSTKRAKKKKREDISKLSDQELRNKLNRMQMEKQYKQMTESKAEKGKKFAQKILKTAVMPMAVAATTAYMTSGKQYIRYGAKGLYKGVKKGMTSAYTKKLVRRIF